MVLVGMLLASGLLLVFLGGDPSMAYLLIGTAIGLVPGYGVFKNGNGGGKAQEKAKTP